MSYKKLHGEYFVDTNEDCDKCGRSSGEYSHIEVVTDDGETTALCIGCLLSEDELVENERDVIEESLSLELTENEISGYESGWSTKGLFGIMRVDFDTRDAESMKQVAVDDFKVIGRYLELTGSPDFFLEEPSGEGSIDKDFSLDVKATRDRINQERAEESGRR